jgi:hypothetical protein
MPVPKLQQLAGLAKNATSKAHRDRKDRV